MSGKVMPARSRIGARRVLVAIAVAAAAWALSGCAPTRELTWSPDSRHVAYVACNRLRILDRDTGESHWLPTGPGDVMSPAWSPGGNAIAFYAVTWGRRGSVSLRVVEPATGQVQIVAEQVWPMPTSVSADQAETLADAQHTAVGGLVYAAAISWSPDGKALACVGAASRNGTVLLVGYPGGIARRVVTVAAVVTTVSWSSDGTRLAYVVAPRDASDGSTERAVSESTQTGGTWSLWLYDVSLGAASEVCDLPEGDPVPGTRLQWSADSSQIGFIAAGASGEMAAGCVVDARPGAPVLHEIPGATCAAAWSPQLTGIVFAEQREGEENLVLVFRGARPLARRAIGALAVPDLNTSGESEQDERKNVGGAFSLPQFSPDGRWVALRVGEKLDEVRVVVFPVE